MQCMATSFSVSRIIFASIPVPSSSSGPQSRTQSQQVPWSAVGRSGWSPGEKGTRGFWVRDDPDQGVLRVDSDRFHVFGLRAWVLVGYASIWEKHDLKC